MAEKIDMSDYHTSGIGVMSGRERGKRVRERIGMRKLDESASQYVIKFPEEVYQVTSSFFLGLFAPSVTALGEDEFRDKYSFDGPKSFDEIVDYGVREALKENSPLGRKRMPA